MLARKKFKTNLTKGKKNNKYSEMFVTEDSQLQCGIMCKSRTEDWIIINIHAHFMNYSLFEQHKSQKSTLRWNKGKGFLTTRMGFPFFQSLATPPFLSSIGQSQFFANALKNDIHQGKLALKKTISILSTELYFILHAGEPFHIYFKKFSRNPNRRTIL